MDNEEIRKLLQELKETSDESSAVRSRIVNIHFDTPWEKEVKARQKKRDEAIALKQKLEEEAKQEAEQEAMRKAAEEAAQEVVREAKAQAAAEFSSDLQKDLEKGAASNEEPEEEESEELDLNWDYDKVRLPGDYLKDLEEEEALDKEDAEDADESSEEGEDGAEEEEPAEDDPDDWKKRMEMPPRHNLKNRPIPDMPVKRSREKRKTDEEKADADTSGAKTPGSKTSGAKSSGAGISGGLSDIRDKFLGLTGSFADSLRSKSRRKEAGSGEIDLDEVPEASDSGRPVPNADSAGVNADSDTDLTEIRMPQSGPEAFWDAEEKAESLLPADTAVSFTGGGVPDSEKVSDSAYAAGADTAASDNQEEAGHTVEEIRVPGTDVTMPLGADMLMPSETGSPAAPSDRADEKKPELEAGESAEEAGTEEAAEAPQKQIAVIDLDESANNRDAHTIPLDSQKTAPLPDVRKVKEKNLEEELEKERKKAARQEKKLEKSRQRALARKKASDKAGDAAAAVGTFVRKNPTAVIIGLLALVALAVVLILAVNNIGPSSSSVPGGSVSSDDGLTVTVEDQPSEYTAEGDVKLLVKAAGEIQSMTINGESVAISGGRKNERVTWHATDGTMEIMVVSTDKVRNATVKLARVDSKAPTVTASLEDGKAVLTAEDTESGVKAAYLGTFADGSDLPLYQEYTEPVAVEDDEYVAYYAVDRAGNKSSPVISTLTAARSMAFTQDSYSLLPDSETKVEVEAKPEGANISGLSLEVLDENVAKLEGGNILKAVSEGTTQITATADGLTGITADVTVSQARTVTLSMIGDCTLGTDANFSPATSFNAYQSMYGNSYFFEKVRSILEKDDATMANFEGALTDSEDRANKTYAFKGDASYADILTDGSVEVVNLSNNHSKDYGDQGLADTKDALDAAGVLWCTESDIAYMTLNEVKTAFIGIYALENGTDSLSVVESTIAEAKEEGAQLIVVHFHWGAELVTAVDDNQKAVAHAAIDAGASLVVGTHAHVLQGIEKYNGRYIVYGLGNFCFGGNVTPSDFRTMIFRQTFSVDASGVQEDDDIAIIPCRVSTDSTVNDYQPTPVTGDEATNIINTINTLSTEFGQDYTEYMVDGTTLTD